MTLPDNYRDLERHQRDFDEHKFDLGSYYFPVKIIIMLRARFKKF